MPLSELSRHVATHWLRSFETLGAAPKCQDPDQDIFGGHPAAPPPHKARQNYDMPQEPNQKNADPRPYDFGSKKMAW